MSEEEPEKDINEKKEKYPMYWGDIYNIRVALFAIAVLLISFIPSTKDTTFFVVLVVSVICLLVALFGKNFLRRIQW